jgi:hypothetical protein
MGGLSKAVKQSGNETTNVAMLGAVSINGDELSVIGVGELRELLIVAPYGIDWKPPAGEQGEVIYNFGLASRAACIGVKRELKSDLEPGELYLSSKGGAYIHLKNDGSITLNGLTIDRSGKIAGM